MKKFSDFAKDEAPLEGTKIPMIKVIGKRILIYAWRVNHSKHRQGEDYLTVQFSFKDDETGEKFVLFTGSQVLLKQATHYNVPQFEATIIKANKYYTFS